ncbi:uncharacterized protein [Coffea arabica]|uniref:Uncharacterized protein n=1 Tax=Coffea arabica TaxID=13443 RepID=A0ABM4VMN4_COFAR
MVSFLPLLYTTASSSVNDEEFNSFHSIDRKLFIRLMTNLGRDPSESVQLMAFWLWLEQEVVDNLTLVNQMLSLPATLMSELADESVMCLKCVESDSFPFGEKDPHELVLLPSFVERNISFQYFYENRIGVLRGVSKMIGEVCSRAFHDLLVPAGLKGSSETSSSFGEVGTISRSHGGVRNPNTPLVEKVGETSSSFGQVGTMLSRSHGGVRNPNLPSGDKVGQSSSFYHVGNSSNFMGSGVMVSVVQTPPVNVDAAAAYPYWLPSYNRMRPTGSVQLTEDQIMENELCHRLDSLNDLVEENDEVSPDERTIFLTFSKGYPISETEVREFFTRKFGDFIEAIQTQEVPPNEQILYARIVARSASVLDAVVGGGRAKYTINGKHVWARKYVRKQKPPPRNVALPIK